MNNFESKIKEMLKDFLREMEFDLDEFEGDVNEAIWKNKEIFGEVAYNSICEYIGDEFLQQESEGIIEIEKPKLEKLYKDVGI